MTTVVRTTLLALGLAAAASLAQAVPLVIANGAFAATYVRDCRSAAARAAGSLVPDRCDESPTAGSGTFTDTMLEQRANLRAGAYTAAISALQPLGSSLLGTTQSSVDASGVAGTLTLHQGAFTSQPYARVSGHSNALQSFFYNGSGPRTRTIQSTLTYDADPLKNQADWGNTLTGPAALAQASVRVFSLSSGFFTFDWTQPEVEFGGVFGSGFSDVAALVAAGYRDEGSWQAFATGAGPLVSNLTLTLQAGRWYFVESYLGLWAKFGGHVDATHTFVSQLGVLNRDDSFTPSIEGLTPSAEGVLPEPPAVALAVLALAGLGALRGRASRPLSRPFSRPSSRR